MIRESRASSPRLLSYKHISSCAFISPIDTTKLLYRVHDLVTAHKFNESVKVLEAIQQKMDLTKYLLQDTGIVSRNEFQEESVEREEGRVSVWDTCSGGSMMSFTQETPVNRDQGCFDWAVDKTMNMINDIDNSSYLLHRTLNSYYSWSDKGLRLVLNLEVQERGSKRNANTKHYQTHLERAVYPLSETILDTKYINRLVVIVIVAELYANELKVFIDSLTAPSQQLSHDLILRLLVVNMGSKSVSRSNKIKNVLKNTAKSLDTKYMSSTHRLSRAHGLSLATKELNPQDVALLADIQLTFSSQFLVRCSVYPEPNGRVYIPFPLVKHGRSIRSLQSQLHPSTISSTIPTSFWLPFTDITCLYASDLITVVKETGRGLLEEGNVAIGLSEKGYQVLQGPEEGLEWNIRNEDCGCVLIGEPCEGGTSDDDEQAGNLIVSHYTANQMTL